MSRRASVRRERRAFRSGGLSAAACAVAVALGGTSRATELPATLPHLLFRGPPAGPAAMPGGDWHRANRSEGTEPPDTLRVVWRRRVGGGISCNVLVDAQGRVFVAGAGHVTELGSDGQVAYRRTGELSECAAAALLADGSRVVLGAEGRLSAWSRNGARRLDLMLDAPARFSHATLLPLPDGGMLASMGGRLFELGPDGEPRSQRQSNHDIVQSLVVGGRTLLVDTAGQISSWQGRSPPRPLGTFGTSVAVVAASDSSTLIGLASRAALAFSIERGEPRPLLSFDRIGLLPLISVPVAGEPVFLRADGSVERGAGGAPGSPFARSGAAPEPLRDAQLVARRDGVVTWLAANVPLEIAVIDHPPRSLPDVLCTQPVSLVPAARGHLVVACRTGQLWLIGPGARGASEPIRPD